MIWQFDPVSAFLIHTLEPLSSAVHALNALGEAVGESDNVPVLWQFSEAVPAVSPAAIVLLIALLLAAAPLARRTGNSESDSPS